MALATSADISSGVFFLSPHCQTSCMAASPTYGPGGRWEPGLWGSRNHQNNGRSWEHLAQKDKFLSVLLTL